MKKPAPSTPPRAPVIPVYRAPSAPQVVVKIVQSREKPPTGSGALSLAGACVWIALAGIIAGAWKPGAQPVILLMGIPLAVIFAVTCMVALFCGRARVLLYLIGAPALVFAGMVVLWGFPQR